MTDMAGWITTTGILTCAAAALLNAALILLKRSAPDGVARLVELGASSVPFAGLALLAVLTGNDNCSSWVIVLLIIPLAIYDVFCYGNAFRLCQYDVERRRATPGLTFGGHVFGFSLFVQWPVLLIAVALLAVRRFVAGTAGGRTAGAP
jgi:hypothetical protein